MTRMGSVASSLFSVADLEGMPDDGRRYELVDGQLLVSPAPGLRHQVLALALYRLLDDACPEDLLYWQRRSLYGSMRVTRCSPMCWSLVATS